MALFLKFIFNLLFQTEFPSLKMQEAFFVLLLVYSFRLLGIVLYLMLLCLASIAKLILELSFFDNFTGENSYSHSRRS